MTYDATCRNTRHRMGTHDSVPYIPEIVWYRERLQHEGENIEEEKKEEEKEDTKEGEDNKDEEEKEKEKEETKEGEDNEEMNEDREEKGVNSGQKKERENEERGREKKHKSEDVVISELRRFEKAKKPYASGKSL
ncbi:uncharacterized protein LOC129302740 [Prosopis cineraria]|uniref:uncharacterized protein LOC129302740 n=1 Tax=Prosopis cineraria TaxID=364024 RepID=UPI00240FE336|nr:uncharacterized protein LOC129302740 [Prosopis cineraria]